MPHAPRLNTRLLALIASPVITLVMLAPPLPVQAEDEPAAITRKATCIRTGGQRYTGADGHYYYKIIAMGGQDADGRKWLVDQQTFTAQTQAGTHRYVVNIDGRRGMLELNMGDAEISIIQIPLSESETLETLGHIGLGIIGGVRSVSRNWLQVKPRCPGAHQAPRTRRTPAPIVPDTIDL